MATYRGLDGYVATGGVQTGTPTVQGAVAQGASSATIDGGGAALTGVFLAGDTFTVAGDAQVYTISASVRIGATTADQAAITFSPSVQAVGGWADNALATFTSNSMSEVTSWSLTASRDVLEDTSMGDAAKTFVGGQGEWSAEITCWLDYSDPSQAELIDDIKASSAADVGLVLGASPGKQFYGIAAPTGSNIDAEKSSLVQMTVNLKGAGTLGADWS